MYSANLLQRLEQTFTKIGLSLNVQSNYIVAKNSYGETAEKLKELIKTAGFCPLIANNRIQGNFVFTIVPYLPPTFFKDLIFKQSNQSFNHGI